MDVIGIILTTAVILAGLIGIGFVIYIAKSENALYNECVIAHAIFKYHKAMMGSHTYDYEVDYDDMRDIDKITWRLWDWGYKHILPPEKFKIIEPFIEDIVF